MIHPDADGTLGEILKVLNDCVSLDASRIKVNASCLTAGWVTVTFGWSFPPDQPDITAVHGDYISFDSHFFTNLLSVVLS